MAEMPEDLQQKAKRRVCMAMDKYDIEKDIATDLKKHFDEECEGSWHCVVSRPDFLRGDSAHGRPRGGNPKSIDAGRALARKRYHRRTKTANMHDAVKIQYGLICLFNDACATPVAHRY